MSEVAAEVFKILHLTGVVLGLWLAVTLLFHRQGNRIHNRLFSLFLFVLSLPMLIGFSFFSVWEPSSVLIKITHKLLFLYPPLIYILISLVVNLPLNKTKSIFSIFPFILVSGCIILGFSFDESVMVALSTSIAGIYLLLSLRLIYVKRSQIGVLVKHYANTSAYWLLFLTLGAFAITFFDVWVIYTFISKGSVDPYVWHPVISVITFYVILIGCFSLYSPKVFFQNFNEEDSDKLIEQTEQIDDGSHGDFTSQDNPVPREKNKPLKELTESLAQSLSAQLAEIVKTQQPHLDCDISLRKLAKTLGVSSHQLSELLNSYLGTNFYEFINQARIQHALSLLSNPKCGFFYLRYCLYIGFQK